MLKIATVCSGIGAPEKALTLLEIPYKLAFFSEIDKSAIHSYCAIHSQNCEKNLGDISRIDCDKLPKDIDLIVGGTPCQDFSVSGLGRGGEEGSGTRSSLMWNFVSLIKATLPKIFIWENVPAVLNENHYPTYRKFYFTILNIGYHVHVKVLNAKFFNLPQNRNRIFFVAIRKDIKIDFQFPHGYDSGIRIRDLLIDNVPDNLFIKSLTDMIPYNKQYDHVEHCIMQLGRIKEAKFKQGNEVLSIDGIFDCLTTKQGSYILDNREPKNKSLRHLTANESLRFMGFTDEDYKNCCMAGVSNSNLYFQAGNSIAVPVLMAIFGELYNIPWKEKVYKERYKTDLQLINELPLLSYLRKDVA